MIDFLDLCKGECRIRSRILNTFLTKHPTDDTWLMESTSEDALPTPTLVQRMRAAISARGHDPNTTGVTIEPPDPLAIKKEIASAEPDPTRGDAAANL